MTAALGAPVLFGRQRQMALIGELVAGLPQAGGAVCLVGDPGAGRTVLLAAVEATARAAGHRVLRVTGFEEESDVAYAAAADLLVPLRETFDGLPPVQRAALEAALGLAGGQVQHLAAYHGARAALAAAGSAVPLVVLVDDYQWIDEPSRRLLAFAARRLGAERVLVVVTSRAGPDDVAPPVGIPTVPLSGLTVAESAQLARTMAADLPPDVVDAVLAATGGNAAVLAATLADLARAPADIRAADAAEPRLTFDPTTERAWGAWLDGLPDGCLQALFAVASSLSRAPDELDPALAACGLGREDLAPARERGVVQVVDGSLRLRHPLLGPLLARRVPEAARRAVRSALADGAPSYTRGWYLAAGAGGPDESVAAALDVLGSHVDDVGHAAAARAWRRAADLSPSPGARAERLVRAAADALAAGRIPTAFAWCREAAQLEPDAGVRQELEAVRRQALHAGEEPAAGRRLLWAGQDDAARIALDDAVRVARRAGAPIALAGALAGRAELHLLQGRWSEAATQAGESLERAQELGLSAAAVDALVLLARLDALRGDAAGCEHRLADAARLAGSAGTNRLRLASAAGLHLLTRADHPGAVAQLQEAAALARALPAPDGVRVSLLADLAEAQARCGDRDGARAVLDELVALGSGHDATEPHAAGFGAHVVLVAGRVSMLLGVDPDEVRVEAGRVRAATTRRMMPFEAARALLAEGEALRRLRRPTAARPALRRAVEAFGAVGALPWSEHAERELTACGGVVWPAGSGRPASPVDALTPQELQVAQEVAQGRNNVEVAAALFVSRKTVEAHLTRAYRKLGARSRTDLTRILAPHLGTDTSESRPPSWGAG